MPETERFLAPGGAGIATRLAALLLAGGLLAAAAPAGARPLEAGAARVDITPPNGIELQGYPGSGRTATGVRDPLYARVLVLGAGDVRLAIVDLDLIAVFPPATLARIREAARPDVSNVLIAAIHTHSGPPMIGGRGEGTEAWEAAAVDRIGGTIHDAAAHRVAARLGVGYGDCQIGHNRLRVQRDGSVTWFEKNWAGVPTAPVDPTVAVLRVDDLQGNPLAVLVNYACHPVTYWRDSRLYSADFPGVMTRVVEEAVGGGVVCFYLQGGAGDINPYHAASTLAQGAEGFCREAGERLGGVAAGVARQILTTASAEADLQVADDTVALGPRWDGARWKAADPAGAARIDALTKPRYDVPVTTVLIDRRIAILAMAGEPFVDFQLQWRARCPVHDCLFMGYSNGYFGYLPTIRAAAWGGYGASHPSTWLEAGAGERLLDHGLARVYEMLGRLKPVPDDLRQ